MSYSTINLAVLVSGSGRTLANFLELIQAGKLDARVGLVIGSKDGLGGIEIARKAGIATRVIERKLFESTEVFSQAVFGACDEAKVDLVCLAGWLVLLKVPGRYEGRVMNIHPALLPKFGGKGMYGLRVHEEVLKEGEKVSGCTVHLVNNEYDSGPILIQRTCPVEEGDTPQTLAARVFELECEAYPEAVRLLEKSVTAMGRKG